MPPPKNTIVSGGRLPPSTQKIKSGSSSFQMPTSSSSQTPKNKSGSGLRILWIPGRRKHQDKGAYKPSNYNIEHKNGDRKNETWNLGGSKSHENILTGGSDDEEHSNVLKSRPASTPASNILPSATLGVTTVNIDNCSESESEIKLEKKDFDSIERIDDLDGQPKLSHQNGLRPKSKCIKTKEDKTVKCLYYTMMCCECTIS